MLNKIVPLQISESTYTRLLGYRQGFETPDEVLSRLIDTFDQSQNIAPPVAIKPATLEMLDPAITQVLKQYNGEAMNQFVIAEVAKLLPNAAKHPNFGSHVSWAASAMRKKGRLRNGHDHGHYGLWQLVDAAD